MRGQDVIPVRRQNMLARDEQSLPGGLVELGETVGGVLHSKLRDEL